MRAPVANACKPLRHEDTVDLIEAHDIGDGSQRDEIEQRAEVGLCPVRKCAEPAELCAQRDQHEEHDAHAGDVLRRKTTTGLIGIDDDRVGQRRARQMMVGDQDVDAAGLRGRHALDAADAVVDRDEQTRCSSGGERNDFRRKSVTELETVGHNEVDVCAQRAQPEHPDGACGGAVGVVVCDDDN